VRVAGFPIAVWSALNEYAEVSPYLGDLRVLRHDGSFVRRVSDGARLRLIHLGLARPVGKQRVRALMLTVGEAQIKQILDSMPTALNSASHTTNVERYVGSNKVYSHNEIRCSAFAPPVRTII
jgi:hypothetical protein